MISCAELPLEPSLSRTLIEANEYGCISQALTVAAMLSAETTLLPGRRCWLNESLVLIIFLVQNLFEFCPCVELLP